MGDVIYIDGQSIPTTTGWSGQVEFRPDLPIAIGDPVLGVVYLVEKPTTILLGLYTTYQSGLYIRESNTGALSDWRRLNIKVKYTDGEFRIVNTADESKQATFDLSLLTTATTRNYQYPDKDGVIALSSDITPTGAFIFDSGGVQEGNTYTDFADMHAAMVIVNATDLYLKSDLTLPTGTFNQIQSVKGIGGAFVFTVVASSFIPNFSYGESLTIISSETIRTLTSDFEAVRLVDCVLFSLIAGEPMFIWDGSGTNNNMILEGTSTFSGISNPVFQIDVVGGDIKIDLSDGCTIATNAITNNQNAFNVNVRIKDLNSTVGAIDGTPTGITAVIIENYNTTLTNKAIPIGADSIAIVDSEDGDRTKDIKIEDLYFVKLEDNPENLVVVNNMSQLPTPVLGKIPMNDGKYYRLGVSPFTLTHPLEWDNTTTITTFDGGNNQILYTGSEDMNQVASSFTGAIAFGNAIVVKASGSNVKIWDLKGNGNPQGNLLVMSRLTFALFNGIGICDNIGAINGEVQYADCGTGWQIKSVPLFSVNNSPRQNTIDSESPGIAFAGTFETIQYNGNPLTIQADESTIQVAPNIVVTGQAIITNNQFNDSLGGEFLATAKSNTGVTFSDNGSGDLRVTSVAHGLTIEMVVTISNAGIGGHDGDHDVLAVIDVDTFDLDIPFLGADTGDWTTGDSNIFRYEEVWNVESNGNEADSSEEFSMEIVNPITVTIPATFTIVEVQGLGSDWVSLQARRFGFELDGDGRIRVLHPKKRTYSVHGLFTAEPVSGGAQVIVCYIMINGLAIASSGYEQDTIIPVGFSPYLQAIEPAVGDYFSIGFENHDAVTDIIIYRGTLNAI